MKKLLFFSFFISITAATQSLCMLTNEDNDSYNEPITLSDLRDRNFLARKQAQLSIPHEKFTKEQAENLINDLQNNKQISPRTQQLQQTKKIKSTPEKLSTKTEPIQKVSKEEQKAFFNWLINQKAKL